MKYAKRIGSFICVIALCFTLVCTPSAHASGLLGGQQFGAWIGAALTAINIVGQSILPAPGPVDPYFKWLQSPASSSQTSYQYPVSNSIISNYMNASTIRVRQGVTTIDGVEYDELWVSPDTFSHGLKTNIFDFKTKWNILSGQSGITLAEGAGSIDGMAIYSVNNVLRSPAVTIPYSGYYNPKYAFGNGVVWNGSAASDWASEQYTASNGRSSSFTNDGLDRDKFPINIYWKKNGSTFNIHYIDNTGRDRADTGSTLGSWGLSFNNEPFKFDYVSGIVPGEESEIPENYGISIKIPHDKLETFYNTYPQYDVDNTTINIEQDQVNINDLTNAIFDLIESMDEIKAEWTNGEEPEPPVPVDPIDNIDQNVQDISQYQQDMQQQVDHMHQDVEAIHQTQQAQQQTQQDIAENSESIDNTLKDIKDTLEPEQITEKTFDLRELFPFCIPFDIYHLLQKFDASPSAPHVQLPIVIPSIGFSYIMDLDFSAWDPVAAAMRTVELIVYALGLAWATSKVIKW